MALWFMACQGHMAPLARRGWDVSATQLKGKASGEKRQLEMDGALFVMCCMCFVLPWSVFVCMGVLICMSLHTHTHLLVFKCAFSLRQHRQVEGSTGQPQLIKLFAIRNLIFIFIKLETTEDWPAAGHTCNLPFLLVHPSLHGLRFKKKEK